MAKSYHKRMSAEIDRILTINRRCEKLFGPAAFRSPDPEDDADDYVHSDAQWETAERQLEAEGVIPLRAR